MARLPGRTFQANFDERVPKSFPIDNKDGVRLAYLESDFPGNAFCFHGVNVIVESCPRLP